MDNIDLLGEYTKLNNSFKKTLVFHIGVQAGFFSEYNNMILTMLYCLNNNIKFVLCSDDANFSYSKGWTDYFLPFCEEVSSEFHHEYNLRTDQIRDKELTFWEKLRIRFYKFRHGITYLTQDLFLPEVRVIDQYKDARYCIPELGIDGDLNQACKVLLEITWRYNEDVKLELDKMISTVVLSKPYVGFHMRDGDKSVEVDIVDPSVYIDKAEELTDIRIAFVLTDDYRVINKLHDNHSSWQIYTFCAESENGYVHDDFYNNSKEFVRKGHIKLFASIEILSQSDLFIGTFTSNPGMYLGMRIPLEKCTGVDYDHWEMF